MRDHAARAAVSRSARWRPDSGAAGRFGVKALVTVGVLLGYLGWLAVDLGPVGVRSGLSHVISLGAPLAAAVACWSAHRLRGGRHSGWAWLAAGCLVWAVGAATRALEAVLSTAPVLSPYSGMAFVGYAVPVGVAISRFPRSPGRTLSRWRLVVDGLVIGVALLVAVGVWVLGPVLDSPTRGAAGWIALARPVADVAVASLVLTRSMVFPRARRRIWLLLSAGLLALAVTDSAYVVTIFAGEYTPGGWLDVGWMLGFALLGLAALAPVRDAAHPAEASGDAPLTLYEQLLPYGAVTVAFLAVAGEPDVWHRDAPQLWLLVTLLSVLAVRQALVVADHTALARSLADAVEERTVELRSQEQWWRDLVQNLSDVVVVIDTDLRIRYRSPSAAQVLGAWPLEVHDASGMKRHVHPDDVDAVTAEAAPVLAGHRRRVFLECRVRRADGSWGWFEVTMVGQLAERQLSGTVLTLHDVSERRHLTDRLAHEAYHDALTGLPNRALLMHRIEEALEQRDDERSALLLVDLDDFKVINDRHGHASGDLVLEVIGRRLRAAVRTGDTVARLGGDEFALLMKGSPDRVRRAAQRLIKEIGRPVVADGRRFMVRASVGVVFAEADDFESPHSMLSHADIALYEAKSKDKGGIVVIDGHERDAAAKQVHLREEIAIPDLSQFSVVYQPIVDLRTGRMRGAEALLRWQHPDLGAVPPDEFIPMAEAGGSIQILGWFVLEQSCAQLARWRNAFPEHRMAMGINVSSRQLDEPAFAARVRALVAERALDPTQVVLELTEQSLSLDFETAVEVVAELRAGGVSVAVDDYGTGYSSLRYLHRFDADVVKIDRSFIAYLEDSVHTQKIVRSVMEMATSLDLQSIGEGIETSGQLRLLRGLGCELGQGYLFSRPVSAEDLTGLLSRGARFDVTTGATVSDDSDRDEGDELELAAARPR